MTLLFAAYLSLLSLLFPRCYSAVFYCCYSVKNAAFSVVCLIAAKTKPLVAWDKPGHANPATRYR